MDPQPGMMTEVYYTRDLRPSLFFRRNALMQNMAKQTTAEQVALVAMHSHRKLTQPRLVLAR